MKVMGGWWKLKIVFLRIFVFKEYRLIFFDKNI
jgi:hypothetical protein